jgi:thiamine-monophosphate kinase
MILTMLDNKKLTPLSAIGEFGLIKRIQEKVTIQQISTHKAIGDDAAVLEFIGKQILLTTDMLTENVHFNLMYTPLKHLGYKSVIVNLSDICAMNGTPSQITVSLAVSNRFSVEAIDELYEGILLACENYGVDLVGGDTTSSQSGLIISITAIGHANADDVVYRNSAQKGDLVCVTGDLGAAYMGLQLLEREKEIYKANPGIQPDLQGNDYILKRQLKPEARLDIVELMHSLKLKPTAMIDISDGLSSEIMHIGLDSGLGAKIYEAKIPIAEETLKMAVELNIDPTISAMSGGEDYELLFTIRPDDYEKIKNLPDFTVIGTMTDVSDGFKLLTRDGSTVQITSQGYNAFLEQS